MLNGKAKSRILIGSHGGRRKAERGFSATSSPFHLPPSAFTLTELLVVITIIAILAGLITAAAVNAMAARNRTVILVEIDQLADAVERFKTETGGAYPPNAMNTYSGDPDPNNYKGDAINTLVVNDFIRSFQKAFPRHKEPDGLLRSLAGQTTGTLSGNPSPLPGGMNAAEAVYFWLGGFSPDPSYPISGEGGPSFANANNPATAPILSDEILENRNRLYEFDLTRLGPRTEDGIFDDSANGGRYVTYEVNINGTLHRRRINLWTYQPKGFESSFVYFDTSRHDPVTYDRDLSGMNGAKIYALKKVREGFSSGGTPAPRDIDFVNKGKYQILHPGLDDAWGNWLPFSITNASTNDASAVIVYPTGPFTGEVADTLTNFSGGTLESAQE